MSSNCFTCPIHPARVACIKRDNRARLQLLHPIFLNATKRCDCGFPYAKTAESCELPGPQTALSERGSTMAGNAKVEKFSARELSNLRNELLQSGFDSWQAAAVL